MSEGVLFVVGGLLLGLFGHRLFHAALGVYGFVIGAGVGLLLVGPVGSLLLFGLVVVVGGLIGAVAVSLLERLAVFLAAASAGFIAGLALAGLLGLGSAALLLAIVCALVAGAAGLLGERLVVTGGTALSGAWLTVCGASALSLGLPADVHALPEIGRPGSAELAVAGLTALFAVLQFAFEQGKGGARRANDGREGLSRS